MGDHIITDVSSAGTVAPTTPKTEASSSSTMGWLGHLATRVVKNAGFIARATVLGMATCAVTVAEAVGNTTAEQQLHQRIDDVEDFSVLVSAIAVVGVAVASGTAAAAVGTALYMHHKMRRMQAVVDAHEEGILHLLGTANTINQAITTIEANASETTQARDDAYALFNRTEYVEIQDEAGVPRYVMTVPVDYATVNRNRLASTCSDAPSSAPSLPAPYKEEPPPSEPRPRPVSEAYVTMASVSHLDKVEEKKQDPRGYVPILPEGAERNKQIFVRMGYDIARPASNGTNL
jgi:hypothetical protein